MRFEPVMVEQTRSESRRMFRDTAPIGFSDSVLEEGGVNRIDVEEGDPYQINIDEEELKCDIIGSIDDAL
jgi:hypothetical protein